ncbi:MAG: hypothetical protein ABIO40_11675 [Devosia sp.]
MCQMCDEYENELARMGLIEDARAFRAERERDHAKALAAAADRAKQGGETVDCRKS